VRPVVRPGGEAATARSVLRSEIFAANLQGMASLQTGQVSLRRSPASLGLQISAIFCRNSHDAVAKKLRKRSINMMSSFRSYFGPPTKGWVHGALAQLLLVCPLLLALCNGPVHAQQSASGQKPNILVIFGDDIGQTNISAYSDGLVGYRTPNIDRIAKEGIRFTDYYAENSCTAGRSSFITGQTPKRTGLSKVGIPGAPVGLQDRDVTIAQALKPLGYATGQFGKNHLGDRDEYLPTKHGFDEFFGNLYHLNAEEEPERPYWPKDDEAYVKANSPRGVLHTFAGGKIDDTGPLTRKRMETIDDETTAAAIDFMDRQVKAKKLFFVWMNTTRMHVFTHVRDSMRGQSGMPGNEYADGMVEHDGDVGKLLKALDDLGIADNTIVVYSTYISTATTNCPTSLGSSQRASAPTLRTTTTTAFWWPSAMATGRRCSAR
jgi:hypothetical protein